MLMGWLVPVMEVCGEEGVLFFFFFKESCVRESGGRQRGRGGRCVCVRERERGFFFSLFFFSNFFVFVYLSIYISFGFYI